MNEINFIELLVTQITLEAEPFMDTLTLAKLTRKKFAIITLENIALVGQRGLL